MASLIQRHELKTTPGYFEQVWTGAKTFEIRYDDRGYQRGDEVVLQEFDIRASCTCVGKFHNIRPACGHDNSSTGGRLGAQRKAAMA